MPNYGFGGYQYETSPRTKKPSKRTFKISN